MTMNLRYYKAVLLSITFTVCQLHAQVLSNIDSLVAINMSTFKGGSEFEGEAWKKMIARASSTNYVLIGEDHFFSELPLFTQALMKNLDIDNYICELDPWTLSILQNKINTLSSAQLDNWIAINYNGFSFFQKKNEFEFLRFALKNKVNIIGAEQICLTSTSIVLQHLVETGSFANRNLYKAMLDSSTYLNEKFVKDLSKPYFFKTAFFEEAVRKLNRSNMIQAETELVDALIRSAEIYKTGSHRNRIKLMQAHLLQHYPQTLKGKKNLFRFGANHSMKGESYLPVIDIGTAAHIFAQAENQDSYHILVLPKAGDQAGFISGSHPIDLNDDYYKAVKPFLSKSSDTDWTYVDLEKIRLAVRQKGIKLEDSFLEKTIKGYDALIIIPKATAAEALR